MACYRRKSTVWPGIFFIIHGGPNWPGEGQEKTKTWHILFCHSQGVPTDLLDVEIIDTSFWRKTYNNVTLHLVRQGVWLRKHLKLISPTRPEAKKTYPSQPGPTNCHVLSLRAPHQFWLILWEFPDSRCWGIFGKVISQWVLLLNTASVRNRGNNFLGCNYRDASSTYWRAMNRYIMHIYERQLVVQLLSHDVQKNLTDHRRLIEGSKTSYTMTRYIIHILCTRVLEIREWSYDNLSLVLPGESKKNNYRSRLEKLQLLSRVRS